MAAVRITKPLSRKYAEILFMTPKQLGRMADCGRTSIPTPPDEQLRGAHGSISSLSNIHDRQPSPSGQPLPSHFVSICRSLRLLFAGASSQESVGTSGSLMTPRNAATFAWTGGHGPVYYGLGGGASHAFRALSPRALKKASIVALSNCRGLFRRRPRIVIDVECQGFGKFGALIVSNERGGPTLNDIDRSKF